MDTAKAKSGLVLARKAGQSIYLGRKLDKNNMEETYSIRIVVDRIYNMKKPAIVINVLCRQKEKIGDGQFLLVSEHTDPLVFGDARIFFAGISKGVSEHEKCYACGGHAPHEKPWTNAKLRFVADPDVKIFRGTRHVH